MDNKYFFSASAQVLIICATFVVVIAGLRAAQPIVVPFLLAVFISVIIAPPFFWLKHKGLPTFLALIIVIVIVILTSFIFASLMGNSIRDFSQSVPVYSSKLQGHLSELLTWLNSAGIEVSIKHVNEYLDPSSAMRFAANMLSELGSVLTNVFLIMLAVIFMLLESSSMPDKLKAAFGDNVNTHLHIGKFINNLKRYMMIKTIISLLTGVAVALILWIIGVDYPLLWGMLAFLLNYIPNLGSIIAAIPAVLLALVQVGPGTALIVGLCYAAVNVVVGSILEPRFMGRGLGLSTLIVFLSLVFWGWTLGPVGMLLSVPLTITLKIALESNEDTKWIAVLLGPAGEKETEPVSEVESN